MATTDSGGGTGSEVDTGSARMRVPESTRAAWGRYERPAKGPKPGLSLERVVAAGISVADAEGLPAVSMGRVAKELGVSTMALYRYVAAKDELLHLMVDSALGDPPQAQAGEGWRAGLKRWAWELLAAYRRHPWALRVPIAGPPPGPKQMFWLERGLAVLADTGIPEVRKPSVVLLVSGYTRNWAEIGADMQATAREAGLTEAEVSEGYGRLIGELIDPVRFPALARALAAGALEDDPGGHDPDDEFRFGLERVLDGIGLLADEGA